MLEQEGLDAWGIWEYSDWEAVTEGPSGEHLFGNFPGCSRTPAT